MNRPPMDDHIVSTRPRMTMCTIKLMCWDNEGDPLTDLNNDTIKQIVDAFGGCTVIEGKGFWQQEDTLYNEDILDVSIAMDARNHVAFQTMALEYKRLAKQESVFVTINNIPLFL